MRFGLLSGGEVRVIARLILAVVCLWSIGHRDRARAIQQRKEIKS